MRIVGVNIPDDKRVEIALTYIYGIGRRSADEILEEAEIDVNKRTKSLTGEEIKKIQSIIEKNHKIEGELRQIIKQNIKRLKETKTYRGIRHIKHLPVRGQRTKSNARVVKGHLRKTVGSGKRKAELK